MTFCTACGYARETLPVTEQCAVLFENSSGLVEHKLLASLHVSDLADRSNFSLPADAPLKVQAIQCGRTSLVPLTYDYKVLAAGFPLAIVSGGRVGVLEALGGRVRFNMLDGEMTESEVKLVGVFLDRSQVALKEDELAP